MKKTYLFLVVAVMLLSLAGCASSDAGNREADEVKSTPTADSNMTGDDNTATDSNMTNDDDATTDSNMTGDDNTATGDGTMNKVGDDLKDATNDVRNAAGDIVEGAGEMISGQ